MQSNANIKIKKGPLILSIIFLGFSCFAFLFIYKGIEENGKFTEQAQAKWQEEATRRNEAKTLDRTMKAIKVERTLLETHFAKGSDIVPFLDTLEGLATKANADAEISSVDVLKDNGGLAVGMKVSGSFSSVYKLLRLLENSPYELEFDSVSLQTISVDNPLGEEIFQWEASFKMRLISFIP